MIEENVIQVARWEAMDHLKLKLNGYRKFWSRVYIGVTSDPQRRWAKHAPKGWRKMVLVYEAYTAEIAAELERDLIDYAHRCNFQVPVENVNPGGEGLTGAKPSHYLYILVA